LPLAGLILGLLAVGIIYLVCPLQYEATAKIQVRSAAPQLLVADTPRLTESEYDGFVNTQIALMRSSGVIDRVLEASEVARLPIVISQRGKREWLTRNLRIEHIKRSEIVSISIKTSSEDASEKIVNAVVDAYFTFIEEVSRATNLDLISNLRIEERRQRQLAQTLQESIREKTRQAAMQNAVTGATGTEGIIIFAQSEALVREIVQAETKLTVQRAQRRAIVERLESPPIMPIGMVIQSHPELKSLTEQREVLAQQAEYLTQTISNPDDDPRIRDRNRQIERTDERIKVIVSRTDNNALETVQNHFRFQEEANLFQLNQEIRMQEILIEELTKKYDDQLMKSAERAKNVLDVSFELAQLERTNRTLDKIEDRILAVTTEQRAPPQITQLMRAVPSVPSRTKCATIAAGVGFGVFFFLPLIVCAVCCRRGELKR